MSYSILFYIGILFIFMVRIRAEPPTPLLILH
jgi:hypothetical protein